LPAVDPLSWSTPREAAGVVRHHLTRTLRIALIVGTILFAINHLDTVWMGRATPTVWLKIGVTYFVPFVVSNVGVLVGTRRR
jgi:hypothetical protein